jgi:peptide subunit release factor 1 (eRF1)
VLPPFPIRESKISLAELNTSLLYETLERKYVIGLVLLTWGSYSIGVSDHENLIESKTGTGYIHKGHRKGGRSEKRLARRTEEQERDFLTKVSNRIEEGSKKLHPRLYLPRREQANPQAIVKRMSLPRTQSSQNL